MRSSKRATRWQWAALALITAGAAILRLTDIGQVASDPFYDAAVRSMGLSWHNFFFGAFEPSGSVSIDKPPVDLWLQVASVKLFGFSSTTLKLPEALAGIVAVPLLFAAVRRMWNPTAGLAAAAAIAVLPVEVITSRSDTMDGVMMTLIVLALLCVVLACEGGRRIWLFAAAAALGLAFDVKLLESLVALPGLALLAYLGLPGTRSRRLLALAAAAAVYVLVALAWLTATLLVPSHERPYAIGSSDGSAWNAAFVFNGTERLGGKSPEPQGTVYETGRHYPTATQSERDHIPIVPPSPTRLLSTIGPLSGERLGLELLVALLLGLPALITTVLADRRATARAPAPGARSSGEAEPAGAGIAAAAGGDPSIAAGRSVASAQAGAPAAAAVLPARWAPAASGASAEARAGSTGARPGAPPGPASTSLPPGTPNALAPPSRDADARMHLAVAAGLSLWTFTGIALFSDMARLHPRYVEGLVPAVAALLGIGVAWAASAPGRGRLIALLIAMAATVYYVERLLYGRTNVWWITLLAALGAIAFALLARLDPDAGGSPPDRAAGSTPAVSTPAVSTAAETSAAPGIRSSAAPRRASLLLGTAMTLTLVAVLALPLSADITAIDNHVTDAGYVGALPGDELRALSAYLRAHQGSARYEVAAESATQIGALIVKDVRPVVVLTTYDARVFTSVSHLQRLIARGEVKYAFLNSYCARISPLNAACSAPARWVRAHGTDVSRQAGLGRAKVLWLLPGARS